MDCPGDYEMLKTTAHLTKSQEKADVPVNTQGKVAELCCDLGGEAEHNIAHKQFDQIAKGDDMVTPLGKSHASDY